LKYDIRDIGEGGLKVSRRVGSTQVREMLGPVGVELAEGPAEVELSLELYRTDPTSPVIFVRGGIHGKLAVPCARCLAPAILEVAEPALHLTYVPKASAEGAPAARDESAALSAEDLDAYEHDGQVVDLEPLVLEQLVLAIPITPLCREDCKGICTGCGAELNREPCTCTEEATPDSPWAKAISVLKKDVSGS
jgi:uncharacterized protein